MLDFLSWWKEDKITAKGTHLKALTLLHNFHQVITKPTHLLLHPNSCIYLFFFDQPNLVVDCCTHSSFNSKCHCQAAHCKLKTNIEYPAPYERLV